MEKGSHWNTCSSLFVTRFYPGILAPWLHISINDKLVPLLILGLFCSYSKYLMLLFLHTCVYITAHAARANMRAVHAHIHANMHTCTHDT